MVVMDIRTYEEQLETMAFLKLINMGKKRLPTGNARQLIVSLLTWRRRYSVFQIDQ